MADKTISALTNELTSPADGDLLAIDDISASETKKIQVTNLLGGKLSDIIDDLTPQLGGNLDTNDKSINRLLLAAATELTIATGAITKTQTCHRIDTEADAASDDLNTINGGASGDVIIIRAENDTRTIVLKDGTGNLSLWCGDVTLDEVGKFVVLFYEGVSSKWVITGGAGIKLETHTHVESDITDLDHDAQKIKSKTVDDTDIANGKILKYNSTSGNLEYETETGGGSPSYVKLADIKSSGTAGGAFNSGAWRTRALTTELSDTDGVCSLSSNQITLAAGTYECRISAPAYAVDGHKIKLINITGSVDIIIGTSEYASSTDKVGNRSFLSGKFTIASGQALEVQHRCTTSKATSGSGQVTGYGANEVFTEVEFWKV